MRFAAYIRYSHEEQADGYSYDAQKRIIENFICTQNGRLVETYFDEAETGRTINNRNDFLRMRQDALKKRFDALVVAKFDRLSRSRMDAIAVKSLLRRDLGVKVFSATEPSEHDGAMGTLIEGLLECVAEWYSLNLSQELKKGKRERALQGLHNSVAPFGTLKDKNGVLIKNEATFPGLLMSYELYSMGHYSDNQIAMELNNQGYRTTQGRLFSTATVRDMLQNKTYTGYVRYSQHIIKSDGRRSLSEPVEWIKGQHEVFISTELFEFCQEIRKRKAVHHEFYPQHRYYLLSGICYCWECINNKPAVETGKDYGKMRTQAQTRHKRTAPILYYRCTAKDFGILCPQGGVRADIVEQQVIDVLLSLKPPTDWRERILYAVGQVIGDRQLEARMVEIKAIIERMDFRWDNGFITNQDEYLEQRLRLQQELDALTPIPDDELERAADILDHFSAHWQATNNDRKAQRDLIQTVVEKVYISGEGVEALVLRPNYFIAIGAEKTISSE
ncbi:MAG TPA: recombinase family protein [Phototrophicaceae bacterium]|nr:recombinase family protein [Phototrophicaceae bacterium]